MEKAWLFKSITNLSCCSWLEISERELDRDFLQEASRGSSLVLCELLSWFAASWTGAHQAPLSMGFPRQEYWSGFSFPFTEDLSHPGIELPSPALLVDSLPSEPSGKACSVVRNRPANTGDTGSIPSPGRSHMPWSNWAHGPQLLSLCFAAGEATAVRSPCTATREQPPLATARESPLAATKTQHE